MRLRLWWAVLNAEEKSTNDQPSRKRAQFGYRHGSRSGNRVDGLRDRWRDLSLTLLLVVQCSTIFILVPADAAGLGLPPGVSGLPQLAFMSLAIVMSRGAWTLWAGMGAMLLVAASPVIAGALGGTAGLIARETIGIVTHLVLMAAIIGAVFGPGPFSRHRLEGAIVLYLNIALLFALVHRMVGEALPGAYTHLPAFSDQASFRAMTDYYSFMTLTSVGYGDVIPVHPMARSVAMLEAVTGQVFPATLLARVVAMSMTTRREPPESDR